MEEVRAATTKPPIRKRIFRALRVLLCIWLALEGLCLLGVPWDGMSFDYWVWLGCPLPMRMFDVDGYPGHNLTARLRHEDYYQHIPRCGERYIDMVRQFGYPVRTVEYEHPENDDFIWMEAIYADFTAHLTEHKSLPADERHVVYTVVTSQNIALTRWRFKVGDSGAVIRHDARYYEPIRETELEPGFTWGYIDGSGLLMWDWVEFQFDENDTVRAILLFRPW